MEALIEETDHVFELNSENYQRNIIKLLNLLKIIKEQIKKKSNNKSTTQLDI